MKVNNDNYNIFNICVKVTNQSTAENTQVNKKTKLC